MYETVNTAASAAERGTEVGGDGEMEGVREQDQLLPREQSA